MMDEDGEEFWDPTFVQSVKDFCEGPLEDAWSNIFVYKNVVVHCLNYEVLMSILNLSQWDHWGKKVGSIVHRLRKSNKFEVVLEPLLRHKSFYLHISFDDEMPVSLFFEDRKAL